ncbi:MAG: HAD-IIA family hydrolase [Acutalibacteraceae bacterium]
MNPVILKDITLFVLDMDGTIYLGERPFPAAIEFIRRAKASGRRIVYFTNNASKNPAVYYEKLLRLGFSAEREEIVTAGDVTAEYLQTYHKGAKVYLVGTPFLEASFREQGIFLTDGREADIVVSSFDTTLTYEKLEKAARSSAAARSSIPRPDFNCPTETGFIPDSGAIAR